MKRDGFWSEMGMWIGIALITLAGAIAGRVSSPSLDCERTCGAAGVATFRVESHAGCCASDTPVCICRGGSPDGGAP